MVGHLLRDLQPTAILQIRRYPRRPKAVVADLRSDAGGLRATLDHSIGVLLPHGLAGERAGLAGRRLEQRRVRFSRDACFYAAASAADAR